MANPCQFTETKHFAWDKKSGWSQWDISNDSVDAIFYVNQLGALLAYVFTCIIHMFLYLWLNTCPQASLCMVLFIVKDYYHYTHPWLSRSAYNNAHITQITMYNQINDERPP